MKMGPSGISLSPLLVHRAQEGDSAARDRLASELHSGILRYFLRLARGRAEEAQEGAQETMVRVLSSLSSLKDPAKLLPWALRIATNVWRDSRRRGTPVGFAMDGEPAPPMASETDAGEMLRLVDELSEPYRSALSLRYLQGLGYESMAQVLDVPAGTLRSHVARGLRLIREALDRKGPP